jgi:sec-independent protein translocase protein TatA
VGNLGGIDGLFVLLIVLLLFGSKKLPELARGLGSAVRGFSRAEDETGRESGARRPIPHLIRLLWLGSPPVSPP